MEGYRSVTRTIVWEILKGFDQISCLNSCFDMCCNKSRVIVNVWELRNVVRNYVEGQRVRRKQGWKAGGGTMRQRARLGRRKKD